MEERDLSGKVVVITGASSGFGKGAAEAFARQGAHVVLAARREELIEQTARDQVEQGGEALAVATDVRLPRDVERLADRALEEFGHIDVWINNAGVGAVGPFQDVPLELHEEVVRTGLLGTLYGSYFAYTQFLAQGFGTLINVSSELGKHTAPYYASYTAAKHGVVGLSQSLRQELDQNGIEDVHVCLVLPTAHDTPFFDHAANYTGHRVEAPSPLHDPQDVVDALVGLALDPEDEKIVGSDGIVKVLLKKLLPSAAEKMGAKQMHRTQMEKAPPGPDTEGAVIRPIPAGTEVSAGRRRDRQR